MTSPLKSEKNIPEARFTYHDLTDGLASILNEKVGQVLCSPIQGDASDRMYFRVSYQKSHEGNPGSAIIMQLKEPHPGDSTDFTRVQKYLENLDLPVPEIYRYDKENGLLFLEDLGQTTLEDEVTNHPQQLRPVYRQAVELLARLQQRATTKIGAGCPAHTLRFDVEKLMWELDFMVQHYIEGLHSISLNEEQRNNLRDQFLSLCQTLEQQEPVFAHRDYHSRNLMFTGQGLVMLDFQDARMGPCQYDLASLLQDSYIVLPAEFRSELLEQFIALKEKQQGHPIDRPVFHHIFDCMALQRNLKAIGTFAFQKTVKDNDRYLTYIPVTLDYVRQTLARQPELSALSETLSQVLPGLSPDHPEP